MNLSDIQYKTFEDDSNLADSKFLPKSISSKDFYNFYHGHQVEHLNIVHSSIQCLFPGASNIFLAGDSSLDNKFWFSDRGEAINGYEFILQPPVSKKDIAYCINNEIVDRGKRGTAVAINCAVEESTVGERSCRRLLPQDRFIQNHIQPQDVLLVSIGGNDIALRPNLCTILNLLCLTCLSTKDCIERISCGSPLPCPDFTCGCGFQCLSSFIACPPGLGHFLHLFSTQIQSYISQLTSVTKPKLILICMIYYLDEKSTGSWADTTLATLGYNRNPKKLQEIIKKIFELASSRIRIPGCEVIAVPMFEVLNGKCSEDYVQRVEPSAIGGEKLAKMFVDIILKSKYFENEPMSR